MGGFPSAASFLKCPGAVYSFEPLREASSCCWGHKPIAAKACLRGHTCCTLGLHWSAQSWVNTNKGEVWLDTLSSPPSTPAAGLIGTDLAGNLLHWIVTSPVFAFDLGRAMAWGRQSMTPSTCQASLDPPGASFLERFSWEGIEPRVANGLRAAHSFTTC